MSIALPGLLSIPQLFAFGINHNTAPLEVRERVSFETAHLDQALRDLVDHEPVREAAIVSTCNRTEVYCATSEPRRAIDWFARFHHLDPGKLEPFLYSLPEARAVDHAFRVASGLDSMVLGEPQILGQIKDAVRSAEKAGTLGSILHKLFQSSFSVAKDVRTRTEIGTSSISMAAAAVRVAEQIYPSIAEQKILFIGAGEMIELCATHFAARGPHEISVANRTIDRAARLAQRFGARAFALSELPQQLARFDIVVSCTASQLPILGKGMIERCIKQRRHRPMLMIDLAVPRDIEVEAGQLDQQRQDKNKLYALHAPEVECIAKRKVHKRYEFGLKVSIAITNRSNLVVGAQSLLGNPCDGHTLGSASKKAERLTGLRPERCYVDLGYRGHDARDVEVFKARQKRGVTHSTGRELERRNAIEPIIGHIKNDGLMHRNYLQGAHGYAINVILCAVGQNLRLILRHLRICWRNFRSVFMDNASLPSPCPA